eukprot:Hpha_TRINITY_DN15728_c1_g1::TRINITY_DN15728_c1_g1_i3::g.41051::m.41051
MSKHGRQDAAWGFCPQNLRIRALDLLYCSRTIAYMTQYSFIPVTHPTQVEERSFTAPRCVNSVRKINTLRVSVDFLSTEKCGMWGCQVSLFHPPPCPPRTNSGGRPPQRGGGDASIPPPPCVLRSR